MTTINIDDVTYAALIKRATERGVTLEAYLRLMATEPNPIEALADSDELRRRFMRRIEQAKAAIPKPNRPPGLSGEFADAMYEKYGGKS